VVNSEIVKSTIKNAYKGEVSKRNDSKPTIHASDMTDFCPRRFALCLENKINYHTTTYLGHSTALTFDIGRKIQDIVVGRIFKTGKLFGTWYYKCCNVYSYGEYSIKCPSCEHKSIPKYCDTRLEMPVAGDVSFVGNVDVFIKEGNKIICCEVKSINKDDYQKITEPLISHKWQTNTYLYLLSHSKTKIFGRSIKDVEKAYNIAFDKDNAVVIYIPKAAVKDPFDKIYDVTLDRKLFIEVAAKLKTVKKYVDSGKIPENIYCSSQASVLARNCQVRKICLGGSDEQNNSSETE